MHDDFESGTHRVARDFAGGPARREVELACNEVDLALAEAAVCLDFLCEFTAGEPEQAVGDAQLALQRIGAAIDRLRQSCARASSPPPGDPTPRRALR